MSLYRPGNVWIRVAPRYARILAPDENQHFRQLPVPVEAKTKMVPAETQTEQEGNDESNYEENYESTSEEKYGKSTSEEENGTVGRSEEETLSPPPPTTSKASPPKKHPEIEKVTKEEKGGELENLLGRALPKQPMLRANEGAARPPKKRAREEEEEPALKVKIKTEQDDEETNTQEEEHPECLEDRADRHRHLTDVLPLYLEKETDEKLREDMALIYDQEPQWLRTQIESEMQCQAARNNGWLNTRDANILMWRNYRLKVSQVTALFGVSGMSNVVRICLAQGTEEEVIHATG